MLRLAVALACSALAASLAIGQQQHEVRARTHLAAPFDVNATALPGGFTGHDCATIARRLAAMQISKDGYESKNEYRDRIDAKLSTPLVGSLTANDPVAFVINLPGEAVRYDAESKLLLAAFEPQNNVSPPDNGYTKIAGEVLSRRDSKNETYIGANAFGAQTKVTRSKTTVCGVGFQNIGHLKAGFSPYKFEVSSDGAKARRLRDNLAVLAVGSLAEPYLGRFSYSISPTLSSPWALNLDGEALLMRLDEVWLFDRRSGEILVKISTPPRSN